MDLKHLRYFIAAVEEGSLQGAAQRVHVAQPALSRRVRDLEAELGCALLERGPRGVVPTRAGLALYREAIGTLESLNLAAQNARRLGLEQDRELRIGLAPGTPRKYAFVQAALSALKAGHPEAGIAYALDSSAALVRDLRDGALDLALLYEQHPALTRLGERLIHRERYVLAAYPSHPLAMSGAIDPAQLAGERLVWLSRRDVAEDTNPLMQALRRHGVEPVIGQLADTPEEQVDLVAAGAGLCLTPASTMLLVPPGQLVFRALPGFAMALDFTLGWQGGETSPPAQALLMQMHAGVDAHQQAIAAGTVDWAVLDGHPLLELPERR